MPAKGWKKQKVTLVEYQKKFNSEVTDLAKIVYDDSETTKSISLKASRKIATLADMAIQRLAFHVEKGEKFALELYFKLFVGIFDKQWLSTVNIENLKDELNGNLDKDEVIKCLLTRFLSIPNIEISEAKDLIKIITNISLNDRLKDSLAKNLSEEDIVKVMAMVTTANRDLEVPTKKR